MVGKVNKEAKTRDIEKSEKDCGNQGKMNAIHLKRQEILLKYPSKYKNKEQLVNMEAAFNVLLCYNSSLFYHEYSRYWSK